MRCVLFYHAFSSCWNNGNAHFLRGYARELHALGHEVTVFEPIDGWSRLNALREGGAQAMQDIPQLFPGVAIRLYDVSLDLDEALQDADLVVVHEWNPPELIAEIARRRIRGGSFVLLFHDTHHRAVTAPDELAQFDLDGFDGVLAFGAVLREIYHKLGWAGRAFTWHEAADVALYHPLPDVEHTDDVTWIGNWGDGERSAELHAFLIEPIAAMKLRATIYGVRYSDAALDTIRAAGIRHGGWLPAHWAPVAFAGARATVHVPRGPYVRSLPGIPTIRVFEAMACGIPLVSAPWLDEEGLFPQGAYLSVADGAEMKCSLRALLEDQDLRFETIETGLQAIKERHTCRHRAQELLGIVQDILAPNHTSHPPQYTGGPRMKICFFGSSLVSSYWNGAATYYRGMLKEIAALGHEITFFEPDAFDRQAHRDIDNPDWASVVVYPATWEGWHRSLEAAARSADMLIKASGVGVFDQELETAVADIPSRALRIYWDVDAPATLEAVEGNPSHHLRRAIPSYDMVLTYGGGNGVVSAYRSLGARDCVPIYNALDPDTHFPAPANPSFACDLSLLANRLPDRERRVERFFIDVAQHSPEKTFVLGGAGWDTKDTPPNIRKVGHVGTGDHNAFFGSGLATLNVNRDSMARYGFSPPTRVFEAIGAGACLITDQWDGIDHFLEPGREVLVAASGMEVAQHLAGLTSDRAREISRRALVRILDQHTYRHRARQFNDLFVRSNSRIEAAE